MYLAYIKTSILEKNRRTEYFEFNTSQTNDEASEWLEQTLDHYTNQTKRIVRCDIIDNGIKKDITLEQFLELLHSNIIILS